MTFLEFIGIFLFGHIGHATHGAKYGFAIGLPDNPTSGGFKASPILMRRACASSDYRPDHEAVKQTDLQP
jgi:hypothetical protein